MGHDHQQFTRHSHQDFSKCRSSKYAGKLKTGWQQKALTLLGRGQWPRSTCFHYKRSKQLEGNKNSSFGS
jgi:hypothetical protein